MKRQIGYFLAQMYFPTMLVVFFSWVNFWIDKSAAPARTSLGVTTVLTITKQAGSAANETPKLAYIKALDYWMSTCMLFVFAALLEYAVVQFLSRQSDGKLYQQKCAEMRLLSDPTAQIG